MKIIVVAIFFLLSFPVADISAAERPRGVQFGSKNTEIVEAVAVDGEGNIYIAGSTQGSLFRQKKEKGPLKKLWGSLPDWDFFVAKIDKNLNAVEEFDKNGKKVWPKQIGTDRDDLVTGMKIDSKGNVYLCGNTKGSLYSTNPFEGTFDIVLLKIGVDGEMEGDFDSRGNRIFRKQWGVKGNDGVEALALHGDTPFLAGWTMGDLFSRKNRGKADIFAAKVTPIGDLEWHYEDDADRTWPVMYGTSEEDTAHDITVDSEGSVYVTGLSERYTKRGGTRPYGETILIGLDEAGRTKWIHQDETGSFNYGKSLLSIDDSLILAGTGLYENDPANFTDIFLKGYTRLGYDEWKMRASDGVGIKNGENALLKSSKDIMDMIYDPSTGNIFMIGTSRWVPSKTLLLEYGRGGSFKSISIPAKSSAPDEGIALASNGAGLIYFVGNTQGDIYGSNNGEKDVFLGEYDPGKR